MTIYSKELQKIIQTCVQDDSVIYICFGKYSVSMFM